MSNHSNAFTDWLDGQENKFGYSDYEVAKQGGFSHSVLSRARSGIPPKWEVCLKIARVFNVSPITVIRKAGLLPAEGGDDIKFEDWQYLLSQLQPDEEEELRRIAEMKIERRKKEQTVPTLKPRKAG